MELVSNLKLDTISDTDKEIELLASEFMNGIAYNSDFVNLIITLSSIPVIITDDESKYSSFITDFQNYIVGNDGMIDREKVKKLDASEIAKFPEILNYLTFVTQDLMAKEQQSKQNQLDKITMLMSDTDDVDAFQAGMKFTDGYNVDLNKDLFDALSDSIKSINELISRFETAENIKEVVRFPKPKTKEDFEIFFTEITEQLAESKYDHRFILKLSEVFSLIDKNIPQTELDPFKNDEFENLLDLIRNIKRLYSKIKNNEIVSDRIMAELAIVFKSFYNQAVEPIVEKYDKMDYQKQLIMQSQCGFSASNEEIVTICHQVYSKGEQQK